MTAIFVKTFFEFLAIALLLYGFVHEKDVIRFEQKLWKAICKAYRRAKVRVAKALYNFLCRLEEKRAK